MSYWQGFTSFVIFLTGLAVPLVAETVFTHWTKLDAQEKFHLQWLSDGEYITFEATVETRGYVALGLSPTGGMPSSDIVLGWVKDGRAFLEDRYAYGKSQPSLDSKQDWTLHEWHENATHTTMRFSRKLQTCDPLDRDIQTGTTRVIWAYHTDDPDPRNGPLYHGSHRGTTSLNLLDPPAPPQSTSPNDVMMFEVLNPNIHVPPDRDTTYWCTAVRMPGLDRKHHIVKFEMDIQPGHEGLVHHIVLYQCKYPGNESLPVLSSRCFNVRQFLNCRRARFLFGWAVGGNNLYFPEDVGLPIGDGEGDVLLLNTHYDNPHLRDDFYDNSGVRIYYTPDLRTYDGGVLLVGSEVTHAMMIPPGADRFTVYGHCSSSCLKQALPDEGVTIFASFLHTHLAGRSIRDRHFRNGKELPPINSNDAYDFNYQQTTYLEPNIKLLPDDNLVLECGYETSNRHNMTFGGLGTWDEMCMDFLMYYPKVNVTHCSSMTDVHDLALFFGADNISINQTTRDAIITDPEKHPFFGKSIFEAVEAHRWTQEEILAFNDYTRRIKFHNSCDGKGIVQANNQIEVPPTFEPLVESSGDKCEENAASQASRLHHTAGSVVVLVSAVMAWELVSV